MAVKLLIRVTSAPCVTQVDEVFRLVWRIRVMRLMRGTPVHRINHVARINHVNCSGGPHRPQGMTSPDTMRTAVTLASRATACPAGRATMSLLFMIPKGF